MDVTPGLRREPGPDLEAVGQDEALAARIRAEIERDGPITFARFMELALYDPDGGYYRAETARPGRAGDFLTAPETHPIFGEMLARAIEEAWEGLGRPEPFVLREYGAGTGTLALTVLAGLDAAGSPLAGQLRYDPVEVEPLRLEAIATRFGEAGRSATLVAAADHARPIVGVRPRQRGPRRAADAPGGRSRRAPAGSLRRLRRRRVHRDRRRAIHAGAGGAPGRRRDRARRRPARRRSASRSSRGSPERPPASLEGSCC